MFLLSMSFPSLQISAASTIHVVTTINTTGVLRYDSVDNYVYAVGFQGVSVINHVNTVVAVLLPSAFIHSSFHDVENNRLYVAYCQFLACSQKYSIAVIKGTEILATISTNGNGTAPSLMTFNPTNKEIYLAGGTECPYCPQKQYLWASALNTSTNRIVATISLGVYDDSGGDVGQFISAIANNPANKEVYVSTCSWNNEPWTSCETFAISALNQITPISGTGAGVSLLTYNPANKEMYVGNPCNFLGYSVYSTDCSVSVLNSKNKIVYNLTSSSYQGFYDKVNQEMFLALGTNITLMNPQNNKAATLQIEMNLGGIWFDSANSDVYIGNGSAVFVVNPANSIVSRLPIACAPMLYNPINKDLYCSGSSQIFVLSS
jgi:hypothetical protein